MFVGELGSQILDMSDESFNQRIKDSPIAQRYEQDLCAYRKSGGANGDVLKRLLAELGDKPSSRRRSSRRRADHLLRSAGESSEIA